MNTKARFLIHVLISLLLMGGALSLTYTVVSADKGQPPANPQGPKDKDKDKGKKSDSNGPKDPGNSGGPKDPAGPKDPKDTKEPKGPQAQPGPGDPGQILEWLKIDEWLGHPDGGNAEGPKDRSGHEDPAGPLPTSVPADPTASPRPPAAGSSQGSSTARTDPGKVYPVCMAYVGFAPETGLHDYIMLPCPLRERAQLETVGSEALPGELSEGLEFLSGMRVSLGKNTPVSQLVAGNVLLTFEIPAGANAQRLAILSWNGAEWKAVSGARATTTGNYIAQVKRTGWFVLAQK